MIYSETETETEDEEEKDLLDTIRHPHDKTITCDTADNKSIEEIEHSRSLKVYTFLARCIAYEPGHHEYKSHKLIFSPKVWHTCFGNIKRLYKSYLFISDAVMGPAVYALNKRFYEEFLCDERVSRVAETCGISYMSYEHVYNEFLQDAIRTGNFPFKRDTVQR